MVSHKRADPRCPQPGQSGQCPPREHTKPIRLLLRRVAIADNQWQNSKPQI